MLQTKLIILGLFVNLALTLLLFLSSNSQISSGQNIPRLRNVDQQSVETLSTKQTTDNKTKFGPMKDGNTTELDMVNEYQPYVDFKFVFPAVTPDLRLGNRDVFLVVFVNSAAKGHRNRRDAIRQSWGNHKTCEQAKIMKDKRLRELEWVFVFVVGKSGTKEDQENIEEAKQHNDLLIGNIHDNYLNNIIKLYMGKLWASTLAPKYILKTDDDVYVRVPGVIRYLFDHNFPTRFYGGKTYVGAYVMRGPGRKWDISIRYFPETTWPPYNSGAFYVISSDLVGRLINYVKHRKPFHTDDTYIGVATRDLKIRVTNIPSFNVKNNMDELLRSMKDCEIFKVTAFGHKINPELLAFLHDKFESMCRKNSC